MALWGNKDLVSATGTISIDVSALTVTGNSTQFSTHGVSEGDVITVGAGATYVMQLSNLLQVIHL